jgi:hypothetical protein
MPFLVEIADLSTLTAMATDAKTAVDGFPIYLDCAPKTGNYRQLLAIYPPFGS